jgi:hypothetical protein
MGCSGGIHAIYNVTSGFIIVLSGIIATAIAFINTCPGPLNSAHLHRLAVPTCTFPRFLLSNTSSSVTSKL